MLRVLLVNWKQGGRNQVNENPCNANQVNQKANIPSHFWMCSTSTGVAKCDVVNDVADSLAGQKNPNWVTEVRYEF